MKDFTTYRPRRIRVSVFLMREDLGQDDVLVSPEACVRQTVIKGFGTIFEGKHLPLWLARALGREDPKRTSETTSALLYTEIDGRGLVVAFGHGKSMLQLRSVVPDFGLKIARRTVDPLSILALEKSMDFCEGLERYLYEEGRDIWKHVFLSYDYKTLLLSAIASRPSMQFWEIIGNWVWGDAALEFSTMNHLCEIKDRLRKLLSIYEVIMSLERNGKSILDEIDTYEKLRRYGYFRYYRGWCDDENERHRFNEHATYECIGPREKYRDVKELAILSTSTEKLPALLRKVDKHGLTLGPSFLYVPVISHSYHGMAAYRRMIKGPFRIPTEYLDRRIIENNS